ncbi:MAG: hypothetical protein V4654_01570 [Bdellovibrionota bacterium]
MKLHSLIITSALVLSVITSTATVNAMSAAEKDVYTDVLMPSYLEEFAEAINIEQMTHNVSYPLSTTEVDDKCVALMDGKMVAGAVGKALSQIFLDNQHGLNSLVSGGTVRSKYCPRYAKMTAKEKSIVWVFILTAMAHFESNCTRIASAKGPNGTAYGYFQLHRGQEDNYGGGSFCKKGDAAKPAAASKCTLGMLEKQFKNRQGELFSNKSYWDVLRPTGSSKKSAVIRRALMRSSLCNSTTI